MGHRLAYSDLAQAGMRAVPSSRYRAAFRVRRRRVRDRVSRIKSLGLSNFLERSELHMQGKRTAVSERYRLELLLPTGCR